MHVLRNISHDEFIILFFKIFSWTVLKILAIQKEKVKESCAKRLYHIWLKSLHNIPDITGTDFLLLENTYISSIHDQIFKIFILQRHLAAEWGLPSVIWLLYNISSTLSKLHFLKCIQLMIIYFDLIFLLNIQSFIITEGQYFTIFFKPEEFCMSLYSSENVFMSEKYRSNHSRRSTNMTALLLLTGTGHPAKVFCWQHLTWFECHTDFP